MRDSPSTDIAVISALTATVNGVYFPKSHGNGTTPLQIHWDRDAAERLWRVSQDFVARWLD